MSSGVFSISISLDLPDFPALRPRGDTLVAGSENVLYRVSSDIPGYSPILLDVQHFKERSPALSGACTVTTFASGTGKGVEQAKALGSRRARGCEGNLRDVSRETPAARTYQAARRPPSFPCAHRAPESSAGTGFLNRKTTTRAVKWTLSNPDAMPRPPPAKSHEALEIEKGPRVEEQR
jgi:hypothetical protein